MKLYESDRQIAELEFILAKLVDYDSIMEKLKESKAAHIVAQALAKEKVTLKVNFPSKLSTYCLLLLLRILS